MENAPMAGDFGSNLMLCIGTLYLLKFIPMNPADACILRWELSFWWRNSSPLFTDMSSAYWLLTLP
ncbi:hypothetical protein KCP69_02035 [Salmonella enterica subsp. enterica]|nr:hypothetical protein KCP69_02035 [Salmonella enterica subsp. enterica]